MNFPLSNHKFARPAASAALAAERQGKFWEYHKELFDNYNRINDQLIAKIARDLGLDMNRFERDRKSQEVNNLINRDLRQGQQIGVRGTPTIFINGNRLQDRSLKGFTQMIDRELKKVK